MPKYIFFYRGGKPKNAAEGRERQPGWNAWFRTIGSRVTDRGAAARSLGVAAGVSPSPELTSNKLPPTTGYSVVTAEI